MRAISEEIAERFALWADEQFSFGCELICLEGLVGSGKSTLLAHLAQRTDCSNAANRTVIDLDDLLEPPVPEYVSYLDRIRGNGAEEKVRDAASAYQLVVVGGVVAWPVVAKAGIEADRVRRVYLKKLSHQGGILDWWDGADLCSIWSYSRALYHASIDNYHRQERPWEAADLIFERVSSE